MRSTIAVILISCFLAGAFNLSAQSPEKFNYQAVVRDASGNVLVSQSVSFRMSILQGSVDGAAVYVETHTATSNAHGQVSLSIGSGTPVSGTFTGISWAGSSHFLKTEMDAAGGTSYVLMGTTQLLSVPYALYAKTSGSGISLSDTDGDTKIQVEETSDEDIIRFDVAGAEKLMVNHRGLVLPNTTDSLTGVIYKGTERFIHNYKPESSVGYNTFVGVNAGNFTMIGDYYNDASNNVGVGYSALKSNTIGYANTANGGNALYSNTSGFFNTAVGFYALYSNTTGYLNTASGVNALYSNTYGNLNTANGFRALYSNTDGWENTAIGSSALYSNTMGYYNTAIGINALWANKANSRSTAVGYQAMGFADSRESGRDTYNTAVGYEALLGSLSYLDNTGRYNTAVGDQALYSNTTGNYNTAYGASALYFNATSSFNVAVGYEALRGSATPSNNTGINNTAVGTKALYSNTSGGFNVAIGQNTLLDNESGAANSALGACSMNDNTTGDDNVAVGESSLSRNTIGSRNTAIGKQALYYNVASSNSTAIGYKAMANAHPSAFNSNETFNTAVGYEALKGSESLYDNTGRFNSALGDRALHSNSSGFYNTALGSDALGQNTTGWENTAIGVGALYSNLANSRSTAVGFEAMYAANNTTSSAVNNVAFGYRALYGSSDAANNTGQRNSAIGTESLKSVTSGSDNAGLGHQSAFSNTSGWENTAIGNYALYSNTTNSRNTAIGFKALFNFDNTGGIGTNNTALGYFAGYGVEGSTGVNNIFLGFKAGDNVSTGSNNIVLGYDVDLPSATANSQMVLGNAATFYGDLSNNRIGIGTTSPTQKVEIFNGNLLLSNNANAGEVRFAEPNGSNFTAFKAQAQISDITYSLPASAGTNGQVLSTDATGVLSWISPTSGTVTGTGVSTRIAFWNTSTELTSNSNLFWDNTNNRLGIGTITPHAALQIGNGTNNRKIVLHEDANNDHQYFGFGINTAAMRYQVAGTNSDHIFYAATSSSASNELARIKGNGELKVSSLSTNGPVYSFNAILTNTNPSDRNLKENIVSIGNSMDKVMALNPVTFTWKSDGAMGIGFIAQEVEEVIPELVNTNDDGTKGIYSLEMIPYLVKALQEQQILIEDLKNRIQHLENQPQ